MKTTTYTGTEKAKHIGLIGDMYKELKLYDTIELNDKRGKYIIKNIWYCGCQIYISKITNLMSSQSLIDPISIDNVKGCKLF